MGASHQDLGVVPQPAFQQDLQLPVQVFGVIFLGDTGLGFHDSIPPPRFHSILDRVSEGAAGRALLGRVGEDPEVVETGFADEVEEVMVRPATGSKSYTTVQAMGDQGTVSYGIGLTPTEKDWVRDCIIAVISR